MASTRKKQTSSREVPIYCDHCGHQCGTRTEYRHSFCKKYISILEALLDVYERGGRGSLASALPIDKVGYTAVGHLTLWGFVTRPVKDGAKSKQEWSITPEGVRYILNEIPAPKHVWVFNNTPVEFCGPDVFASQVTEGYQGCKTRLKVVRQEA